MPDTELVPMGSRRHTNFPGGPYPQGTPPAGIVRQGTPSAKDPFDWEESQRSPDASMWGDSDTVDDFEDPTRLVVAQYCYRAGLIAPGWSPFPLAENRSTFVFARQHEVAPRTALSLH